VYDSILVEKVLINTCSKSSRYIPHLTFKRGPFNSYDVLEQVFASVHTRSSLIVINVLPFE